ncbi:hypothetical protein Y88_1993 [Novosphingobium nitrogenifigens DSM 19370]|uniref:Uncharacterized protein n=1 Tax=Novosphingobium nitrogenifigens DSM 19370 TaxID=983920 RepID=F1Z5K9_9SPHN|nr:hypothetical protein [Novosphingobium nitrogenifigens]EGD60119.1 hypothetical protein Y88_1993 [Novosphingobium nitrogenifigens DSM 19370]
MYTASYDFSNFNAPSHPHTARPAEKAPGTTTRRTSPVLSREELRRIVMEMVG